jgi:hypothetical protein
MVNNSDRQNFIDAVNDTLSAMSKRAMTDEESITRIAGVLTLDEKYAACLNAGMDYYLTDSGYKSSGEEQNYYVRFNDELRTALMANQKETETRGKYGVEAD